MRARVVVLGIVAFLLALLAVLPASWVAGLLPAGTTCGQWRGSVWRGHCANLTIAQPGGTALQLQSLQWRIAPLALLTLTLRADLALGFAQGDATGRLDLRSGGRLLLRDVTLRAVLDQRLAGALPAGWNGRLEAESLDVALDGPQLRRLAGRLRVLDFSDGRGGSLGSYEVVFAPTEGAPFTGQLRDAGGPLEVGGQLVVAADQSWTLDGVVTPRPGANQALVRQLDLLGAADAAGRRRLSAAGGGG